MKILEIKDLASSQLTWFKKSEISESQSLWQSYIIILQLASRRDVITCFRHVWLKINPNLSISGGKPADISVCSDCFICGKSSMTHRVLNRAQDRLNQLLGPWQRVQQQQPGKKKKFQPEKERKKKPWMSIGCDNYNFLSKAPKFTSDVLHSCLWQK